MKTRTALIGLGSSMGDRERRLALAVKLQAIGSGAWRWL